MCIVDCQTAKVHLMSDSDYFVEATLEWDLERLFSRMALQVQSLTEMEKLYLRGLLLGHKPQSIAVRTQRQSTTVRGYLSIIYRHIEALQGLPPNSVSWRDVPLVLREYRLDLGARSPSTTAVSPSAEEFLSVPSLSEASHNSLDSEWDNVPEVFEFYGREAQLKELQQWVKQPYRVITISGHPGIGKTTLIAVLAAKVRSQFDRVVWRSLRDAPPLSTLLKDLRIIIGTEALTEQASIDVQLDWLMRSLQQSRLLLILDGADGIFEDGSVLCTYRSGYENYGELFQRFSTTRHKSCVVLTGWEDPGELGRRGGQRRPVRGMRLKGLDPENARLLLMDYELKGEECWDALIDLYRGNPLGLHIVAMHILEVFDGDVREFWKEDTIFLGELTNLLHTQFVRLSPLERAVMQYLAKAAGKPVSRQELQDCISFTQSRSLINEAIAALKRRSLIEEVKATALIGYSLPPVILKYVRSVTGPAGASPITSGLSSLNQF